jgi:hypothetical protein
MRRWGHILQILGSTWSSCINALPASPPPPPRRLPTPLAPGESATSPWVLSELLTNALRHGCGDPADEIDVHIQETDAGVRIEMVQPCPIFEPGEVRRRVPGEGRGWASCSTDALAASWGWMGLGAAHGRDAPAQHRAPVVAGMAANTASPTILKDTQEMSTPGGNMRGDFVIPVVDEEGGNHPCR